MQQINTKLRPAVLSAKAHARKFTHELLMSSVYTVTLDSDLLGDLRQGSPWFFKIMPRNSVLLMFFHSYTIYKTRT